MKLHAEKWAMTRADPLIRAIVNVHEPWLPISRERLVFNSVAMILARDMALPSEQILYGLIHPSMSVWKLAGVGAGGESQ